MFGLLRSTDYEGDYSNLIRINPLKLRMEQKELFWNMVYYFNSNDFNYTFLLPYQDDFKIKRERKNSM